MLAQAAPSVSLRFPERKTWARKSRSIASHSCGAPIEIEGNGDGADFGEREQGFEMLGAAADRKADQVAFAEVLR